MYVLMLTLSSCIYRTRSYAFAAEHTGGVAGIKAGAALLTASRPEKIAAISALGAQRRH
jgi:hypothetical protein